jgi:hypothetical protein
VNGFRFLFVFSFVPSSVDETRSFSAAFLSPTTTTGAGRQAAREHQGMRG